MIDIDQDRDVFIRDGGMAEVAHVIMFQGRGENSQREPQKLTSKIV